MYKNLTFMTKLHNLNTPFPLKILYRTVMPLFEITIYDLKQYTFPQQKRGLLLRKKVWQKSHQIKKFDKLLCLHANIDSNCRRDKLINKKRSCLIQYCNNKIKRQLAIIITLSKANHYVPQQQLIKQMDLSMQNYNKKIIYETSKKSSKSYYDISKLKISQILNQIQIQKWSSYLNYQFPSKNIRNIRFLQLQNSYLQVSILNYYKIKYSLNKQMLYEDMKNFDKMLSKFNFIRFFVTNLTYNQYTMYKNCQRFIKKLKWNTSQTQEYLLLLLRSSSWERFYLTIQNFIFLYQTQHLKINEKKEIIKNKPR